MSDEVKRIGDVGENLLGFHGIKKSIDPLGIMGGAFGARNIAESISAPAPPAMPDPDSEAVAAARRRKLALAKSRGGRQSTILQEEPLGGSY